MPQPIRCLFAIGSLGGGGSERQLVEILRRLDRDRFAPRLYVIDATGPLRADLPEDVPVDAFNERCPPLRINWPGRILRRQIRDFTDVLRRERIELVYDRTFFMTMRAAPACRAADVRRVSVVVSPPGPDLAATAGRFAKTKRRWLRQAYLEADRVVAVSRGLRDETVRDYALPERQVMALPNFVDLERIDRLAAAEPSPLEGDHFDVVAAGRLGPEKGFDIVLAAVDDLVHRRGRSDVRLHVLGEGPLRRSLEQDIDRRALAAHVRLHGFVANPYPFFRNAQLFCLTSHYEGMPGVLLEAMACGAPVVATDCHHGPREILEEGRHGLLVPVDDAAALAVAIDGVIDETSRDPDAVARGVEAARDHVTRNYAAGVVMPRIERLLEEACGRAPVDH